MRSVLLALMLLAASASASPHLAWEYRLTGSASTDIISDGDSVYVGTSSGRLFGLNRSTGRQLVNYTSTAGIYSAPLLAGDRVIFGSDNGIVYSVNRSTGNRTWSFMTGARVRSSPRADSGSVYFGSDDGRVYAVSESSGKRLWSFNVGSPVSAAPLAENWKVFFVSADRRIWAFSNLTGKPLWNRTLGVMSSPPGSYGDILLVAADRRVLALDKADGKVLWNVSANGTVYGPPVVSGDNVVFSSSDKNIYSVSAYFGERKWVAALNESVQSPVSVCGVVYVGAGAGFRALDASSGAELWAVNVSYPVKYGPSCLTGAPVVAAGSVIRAYGKAMDVAVADISLSPASVAAGRRAIVTVAVKNRGDAVAADFDVALYVDRVNVSRSQVALEPGQTRMVFANITVSYGRHLVEAYLDEGGRLVESDKGNGRMGMVFFAFEEWPTFQHDGDRTGWLDLRERYTARNMTPSWSCSLNQTNRSMADLKPLWAAYASDPGLALKDLELRLQCSASSARGYPTGRQNSTWSCSPYNSTMPEKGIRSIWQYNATFNESAYNLSVRRNSVEYPFNLTDFTVRLKCGASGNLELPIADAEVSWACRLRTGLNVTPYNLLDAWSCTPRYASNYSLEDLARLKGYRQNGGIAGQSPQKLKDYGLLWDYNTGDMVSSSPVLADLGRRGDGRLDIIFGSYDGGVYALSSDGNLAWKADLNSSVTMVSAADPDGDGIVGILAGTADGRLVEIGPKGDVIWSYQTGGAVLSSPIELDIDTSPGKELIFGSKDGKIYALDHGGKLMWTYQTSDAIVSSPSAYDIDGDGKKEVMVGSTDNILYIMRTPPYKVWMFQANGDVDTPKAAHTYSQRTKDVIAPSSDGNIYDINYGLMASDEGERVCGPEGCAIEAISKSRLGMRWNFTADGPFESSPAIVDVDRDGRDEIFACTAAGSVYAINSTGDRLMKSTVGGPIRSSPAAADLDGDGCPELILGSDDGKVYVLNASGWKEFEYKTGGLVRSSPAVGDVNADGLLEFAAGSYDGGLYLFGVTTTSTTTTSTLGAVPATETATSSTTSSTSTTTTSSSTTSTIRQVAPAKESIPDLSGLLAALTLIMGAYFYILMKPCRRPKTPGLGRL
ncbi:MAG: PQQ-binding-like beta-propeller repeat protein [Candidatus Altiarchaeota archaeon]